MPRYEVQLIESNRQTVVVESASAASAFDFVCDHMLDFEFEGDPMRETAAYARLVPPETPLSRIDRSGK